MALAVNNLDSTYSYHNAATAACLDPPPGAATIPSSSGKPMKMMTANDVLRDPSIAYLVARLPTVASLSVQLNAVQDPSYDPAGQVSWCHEVLDLVERTLRLQPSGKQQSGIPARIADPEMQRLVDTAIPMLLKLAGRKKASQSFVPGYVAEAIYLCSTCEASGAFPQHIPHNPKHAFSQCDQAARAGYHPAWLDLARDFEKFGDMQHARDCFEYGAQHSVPGCLFRLGMGYLTGQLGLPVAPDEALLLLRRAATHSTPETPHPAYIYALLLLNELTDISLPPRLLASHLPPDTTSAQEARRHLERAAYLDYGLAQTRLGQAYEFADDLGGFPFDPMLSVQYYGLAAAQGDAEAEMALSKWFLCGSEDVFERDEALAVWYAESAAKRGLPSAMFAMGYYTEVGVGCEKDIVTAQKWYQMAAQQGNTDAADRLQELSRARTLSRREHEQLTETTLVRKRTQARMRSDATPRNAAPPMPSAGPSANPAYNARPPQPMPAQQMPVPPRSAASLPPDAYQARSTSQPPRGRSPPGQQQLGVPPPRAHPQGRGASVGPGGPSSRGPSPAPPRGYGSAPRGVSPAPPRGPAPQASLPVPRSAPASRAPSPGPARPPAQATPRGPQTFEAMGIQTGKAENKDCVIM